MQFLFRSIIVSLLMFLFSQSIHARARHELGVFGGPFLLSQADEIMQSVGGRFSFAVNSNHINHLELRAFTSNTTGSPYYLGEISIRNEFKVGKMAAIWLLGMDYHYFQTSGSTEFSKKSSWHAGVGLNLDVGKNIMFRNDYIVRFSDGIAFTGMSLLVTVGFAWAFGAPDAS